MQRGGGAECNMLQMTAGQNTTNVADACARAFGQDGRRARERERVRPERSLPLCCSSAPSPPPGRASWPPSGRRAGTAPSHRRPAGARAAPALDAGRWIRSGRVARGGTLRRLTSAPTRGTGSHSLRRSNSSGGGWSEISRRAGVAFSRLGTPATQLCFGQPLSWGRELNFSISIGF